MCISVLAAISFSCFCNKNRKKDKDIKNVDMYSKGNFNEVLCDVNDYFSKCFMPLDLLKEKNILINDEVYLCYDKSIDKFYISYRYKGIEYKKFLRYIQNDGRLMFFPIEKKYISKEGGMPD